MAGEGPTELARGTIVDKLVAPMSAGDFMVAHHERRWGYFPHNESLVPIDLAQVSDWLARDDVAAGEVVEVLPHPNTGREFEPSPRRRGALERAQDAFLRGHSMVINSLHRWSEQGLLLARELYVAVDLPVDVYMYLTPPHSRSYGVHADVMDAWLLQLAGSKRWRICNVRNFEGGKVAEGSLEGQCQELTMRGGDVMYVPFATLHQATTGAELSAHLTVNVERQYFVWAALLIAAVHKVTTPALTAEEFLRQGGLALEGERDIEQLFLGIMRHIPRLALLPLSSSAPSDASRWLVRSLSGDDLPEGYLAEALCEFTSVAAEAAGAIAASERLSGAAVSVGSRRMVASDLAVRLEVAADEATLRWVLEVCRIHAVQHFARDVPKRILPSPELFSSLAAARAETAVEVGGGLTAGPSGLGKLLSERSVLVRPAESRAVLVSEGLPVRRLLVGVKSVQVDEADVAALQFCLGFFASGTAQGRPFRAGDVPGGLVDRARAMLGRLLAAGALRLLSPTAWSGAAPDA